MEETVFVHVREPTKNLKSHAPKVNKQILDLIFCELLGLLFHLRIDLVEVVVKVLEDHVKLLCDEQNFLEFDQVLMDELSQGFDLPQLDALIPTGVLLFHLFNRNDLSRLNVLSFVYCSKGSVTEGFYRFVFLHVLLILIY